MESPFTRRLSSSSSQILSVTERDLVLLFLEILSSFLRIALLLQLSLIRKRVWYRLMAPLLLLLQMLELLPEILTLLRRSILDRLGRVVVCRNLEAETMAGI